MSDTVKEVAVPVEVVAPVPLGGQPAHPQAPTAVQVQSQAQSNAPVVDAIWKELRDKLNEINARLPQGNDLPTGELRSWLHYNRSVIGDHIKD